MSSLIRSWMVLGLLAFVANAAVRPAVAQANDAPPAGAYAPAPSAQPPAAPPPAGNAAPPPAPYQAAPYPPTPYGYPPPGYAPAPQYPAYGTYPAYPPPQPVTVHRPRRGLVTGGAITFGVSWGLAASISLLLNDGSCTGSCSDSADYLWIPIVGPLVVAARDSSSGGDGIFFLWSAAQAAGATMLVVGLIGHDVTEYRYAKGGATLQLTPLFARNTSGMALTARW